MRPPFQGVARPAGPGEVKDAKEAAEVRSHPDPSGGWVEVVFRSREGRWKKLDRLESRSIVFWGVDKESDPLSFFRKVVSVGRLDRKVAADAIPMWYGNGAAYPRRMHLLCSNALTCKLILGKLKTRIKRLGWSARPGRRFEVRRGACNRVPVGEVRQEPAAIAQPSRYAALDSGEDEEEGEVAGPEAGADDRLKEDGRRPFRLATFNANSLSDRRLQELASHVWRKKIDITAVQETKWRGDKEHCAEGVKFMGTANADGLGGVGFLLSLKVLSLVQPLGSEFRDQYWIKIPGGKKAKYEDIYVCSVYMPQHPMSKVRKAFEALDAAVAKYQGLGLVIVLGDLNVRLGKPVNAQERAYMEEYGEGKRSQGGKLLVEMLLARDLASTNCRDGLDFTRYDKKNKTASVIDYVLVSRKIWKKTRTIVDTTELGSDHQLVTATIEDALKVKVGKVKKRSRWNTAKLRRVGDGKEANDAAEATRLLWASECNELADFDPAVAVGDAVGLEASHLVLKDWCRRVNSAASKVCKKKKVGRKFQKAWYDDEVKDAIRKRRRKYEVFRSTGDRSSLAEYWVAKKAVKQMVETKKKACWDDLVSKLTDEFDDHSRLFWTTLQQLGGSSGGSAASQFCGPIRGPDGELVFDDAAKRETIAAFWERVGNPPKVSKAVGGDQGIELPQMEGDPITIHSRFDDVFRAEVEQLMLKHGEQSESFDDVRDEEAVKGIDRPFTPAEIAAKLKKLKEGKAIGPDGIPTVFLKHGGPGMVNSLVLLFNWFLSTSRPPSEWSKATMVLLFKKGDKADPGNYRGISLLDIVGKLFTGMIADRIERFLIKKSWFHVEQAGFTAGRGCPEQVHVLYETLSRRKAAGEDTYCFFLDVRKAFPSVWRDGLMHKLWEAGVRGKMWRIIRAVYSENKSACLVNGEASEWYKVGAGVREGGPESPLLFKIFINGLIDVLRAQGLGVGLSDAQLQALLYADDLVLLAKSREELQLMIDAVARYTYKWRMEEVWCPVGKGKGREREEGAAAADDGGRRVGSELLSLPRGSYPA